MLAMLTAELFPQKRPRNVSSRRCQHLKTHGEFDGAARYTGHGTANLLQILTILAHLCKNSLLSMSRMCCKGPICRRIVCAAHELRGWARWLGFIQTTAKLPRDNSCSLAFRFTVAFAARFQEPACLPHKGLSRLSCFTGSCLLTVEFCDSAPFILFIQ